MRIYFGSTADELQVFLKELTLDLPDAYAPTPIFSSTHPEMDQEEIEYSLSLLAAEDALELVDENSGLALVIACEVPLDIFEDFEEVQRSTKLFIGVRLKRFLLSVMTLKISLGTHRKRQPLLSKSGLKANCNGFY